MSSGAMIYIQISSAIQQQTGGYTDTETAGRYQTPNFIFSKQGKWPKISSSTSYRA
jgi:hypothetical protein